MGINLIKSTGAPNPLPPYVPPVPANVQAYGQVAGGTIANSTWTNSVITTTASTGMYVGGGSGVVYVNTVAPPRKARRPREKRQVPLFTAGLEAKLNKNLDKDARQILRYISRKVQQMPTIVDGVNEDVYEFSTMFQYAVQTGFNWNNTQNMPPIDQHTVRFYAKLFIRTDGTLREYEVRMGGAKR